MGRHHGRRFIVLDHKYGRRDAIFVAYYSWQRLRKEDSLSLLILINTLFLTVNLYYFYW